MQHSGWVYALSSMAWWMTDLSNGWTDTRPHRLYAKGRVLGHKRGKRNTRPNTSLLQIEGVGSKEDAQFYLGKVRVDSCFLCCNWS